MKAQRETASAPGRFPPWLRKPIVVGAEAARVRELLSGLGLSTVCAAARCPNLPECFARKTATFLILGNRCTRGCRFCAVEKGEPFPLRPDEPQAVAMACAELGLRHVVITSVTRDDLGDGGAAHFARTIRTVRRRLPHAVIEVLTPDFQGDTEAVDVVLAARPDILNHNVETAPRLYPLVRPQADFARSLAVLDHARRRAQAGRHCGRLYTKSGLMVGLGETDAEVRRVMRDLRGVGCDILTIGQYLRPSASHLPVARFVKPARFDLWRDEALRMGFAAAAAGPFVRSSYQAERVFEEITNNQ